MNEIKDKFLALSPRDQLMIVIGTAVVVLYILIFVVLFPMQNNVDKLDKRVFASLDEQQRVHKLAGSVMANQQEGGGGQQSINALLNNSLGKFGLRMDNFQPSGSTARVRLDSADFNKVMGWLHEMEIKQNIQIKDLTITADDKPGAVLVNIQLQQGE